jgi:hypothetical protein
MKLVIDALIPRCANTCTKEGNSSSSDHFCLMCAAARARAEGSISRQWDVEGSLSAEAKFPVDKLLMIQKIGCGGAF